MELTESRGQSLLIKTISEILHRQLYGHLDKINLRKKNLKLHFRCFINFFCSDAVFDIFFYGCGVDSPPISPSLMTLR